MKVRAWGGLLGPEQGDDDVHVGGRNQPEVWRLRGGHWAGRGSSGNIDYIQRTDQIISCII